MKKVLGFSLDDIRGQNIKVIMPPSIAELHDLFLENFVKNSGVTTKRDATYLFFPK
jgi:hypothetical protein